MLFTEYLIPIIVSFVISALLGPVMIPALMRIKAGQTVRDDGPQSHIAKNGTPTIGGLIFLVAFTLVCLWGLAEGRDQDYIVPVMIGVLGFAVIGFIDDFIKVVLKRSMGLRAWQKFLLQILLSIAIILYLESGDLITTTVIIPFTSQTVDFGAFYYIFIMIVILGTVNGANFTDGLDGLASKVTAVIAVFMMLASVYLSNEIWYPSAAMLGALMGFLLYNSHKASVFMGDTGSLALGGFVAVAAMQMQIPLFIILVAFIYLAEVCSVIIQVGYFKISHGKRVFRMAPIHHHYELGGWTETKVVAVFTIVTALLCAVAMIALEMY